jgi:site-specific DNA-methyltransferase (adenine-specific)
VGTRDGADGAELVTIDLRCGRWQDALADVEMVDAVITDPPYTKRVHLGYRKNSDYIAGRRRDPVGESIEYGSIDEAGLDECVEFWCRVARHWIVAFNDHIGAAHLASSLERRGWFVFAPVAWVKTDAAPRFNADGPSVSVEWITVARPKRRLPADRVGHRPGHYISSAVAPVNAEGRIRTGQKPIDVMRSLVRDYTLPGDLILEPFAGSGTTLLAAAIEGRRAIGAEMDPETFAKAQKRIARGYTPTMFADPVPEMKQEPLL